MRNQKFLIGLFTALLLLCLQMTVFCQTKDDRFANVTGLGSSVRWDVNVVNAGLSLTISAPDGRTFRKEFHAGSSPDFMVSERLGLPDGVYTYELRATPVALLKTARPNDDEPENTRNSRPRTSPPAQVQSGSFTILNGQVIVAGAVENTRRSARAIETVRPASPPSANTINRLRNHRLSLGAMPDFVIADDLIVQGSACVGLDCVNGEVFGFDTIRTKENNTRIQFTDTSTAAGFPTNNWQIRANSSASGGANFLAFVDQGADGNSETGTILFEVDAGAPANSLKVSSSGKVGLRTATPVLDLHMNTGDTPAARFEQNSSGGFTAQTWDVAGNEANFFVRDVTGGSRLPFRIRPGAPTSSIDISANGNVGVGTASPGASRLTVSMNSATDNPLTLINSAPTGFTQIVLQGTGRIWGVNVGNDSNATLPNKFSIFDANAAATRLAIDTSGQVGIGTTAPTALLSVNGTANKPGGGSWDVFSDERLKNIKGRFNSGLKAVMQLQPFRYEYKSDNALGLKSAGEHIGFGAAAVQKIIPEAVTRSQSGYLMVNNDPILWTMLNAIKEQQKEIAELKGQIRRLQSASHRRGARPRR